MLTSRRLASGEGWWVEDVVCTSGPRDRPEEERHAGVSIALVIAGSFQYRSSAGRALMTPGSVLLGNPDEPFECAHDHGAGDRCVSFKYSPEWFERIASDAGARPAASMFPAPQVPSIAPLSSLAARVCAGLVPRSRAAWEELALEMAVRTLELAHRESFRQAAPRGAEARVARVVRAIELGADEPLSLSALAAEARLSRYHFLRTFQRVTGVTPHQYLRRVRLRRAAAALMSGEPAVIDVAFDCGFGDLSAFNRAFRAEFGMSPRALRRRNGS